MTGEIIQRSAYGHIDMDGSATAGRGRKEGLVDETVAVPVAFAVAGRNLRQIDGRSNEASESPRLQQRLTVELVNPLLRTVGGDHYEGHALIEGLGDGGREIEQCRPRRDADDRRQTRAQGHAQGVESRTALVGNGIARQRRTLAEVVDDRGIARARTDNGVADAVGDEQRRENIYVFLVRVHPSLFLVFLPFPSIRRPHDSR